MPRPKFTAANRLSIAQRAGFCCEYCQTPEDFSPDIFDIEHIISLANGGKSDDGNLALACGGCNAFKSTAISWTDPLTNLISPLFHPRQDTWSAHFNWNDDFTELIGLTPKGRATIEKLKMNRHNLVNLRKALISYGVHPKQTSV